MRTAKGGAAAIQHCKEFSKSFANAYGWPPQICRFMRGARIFADGYIAWFDVDDPIQIVYAVTKAPLCSAAHWLLWRPMDDYLEGPGGSSMKDSAWIMRSASSVAQFFVLSKPGDRSPDARIEALRVALSKSATFAPFTFSDGAVLAMASTEPLSVSMRRCERALSGFADWYAVSSDDVDDVGFDDDGVYFDE